MNENERIVQSPCVRNCCLNGDDICLGCFRSLQEICIWSQSDDLKRTSILQNAGQRRESAESSLVGRC